MKPLLSFLGHQKWLRFGLRDRIIRLFHHPDTAKNQPFETTFFGKKYPGNFQTFIDWNVYYYGAYEENELKCMRDFLAPITKPVVVDVGANIGHHSLFASTIAAQVHSFEPYDLVAKKLEEKIDRNNLTNITVHKVGLGNKNQAMPFNPPENNNTGTGSFVSTPSSNSDEVLELMIKKADDYFKETGITQIDYLKMDVEGFEIEALTGMASSLENQRPICFFEWSQNERGGDMSSGAELFPKDYSYFNFADGKSILIFFQNPAYRLIPTKGVWTDGNIVAVPNEKLSQYKQLLSNP